LSQLNLENNNYRLVCPQLPLAVYREVAAHLRQVEGVGVELVTQTSLEFNYYDSQIESMCVNFAPDLSQVSRHMVAQILSYYAKCHGDWQTGEPENSFSV
jgi:hypothetical protein